MKNKHLRQVIAFGTVVLAGLFLVQIYWFRKAFNAGDQQFDHSVQIALMRVADSVSGQAQIKRLSSNFYFVATESNLNGEILDTLLRTELSKRNLVIDYELGVYNAEDDTLVYGQYVEATKKQLFQQRGIKHDRIAAEKNFAVYFPKKENYLIAQLDIWIFSSLALLFMMCFFAYAIVTLLRERRFSEMKNDFINNMTHEFKTPVTNIGITGEIMKKKLPEESGLNVYVDILMKENEKLRHKIENVLSRSSLDHRNKPALDRVDIHKLIGECADAFDLKVRERNGSLRLELTASNSLIQGDRELLAQAINNVIDNAEKYSPSNPHIVVKTINHKSGIAIHVIDKGLGIPEKVRGRVFEKFFRGHQGNTHNVKGFGLGLSFVKNVIRAHRGQVNLFSEEKEGTEIRITLPNA